MDQNSHTKIGHIIIVRGVRTIYGSFASEGEAREWAKLNYPKQRYEVRMLATPDAIPDMPVAKK